MAHRAVSRRRTTGPHAPLAAALLAAAVLGAGALTGCAGSKPTPSLQQLSAIPAAGVRYPSAQLLGETKHDSNTDFGPNAANLTRTWATADAAARVYAYFDQRLPALGWTRNDNAAAFLTSWVSAHAYTSGKRVYVVAVEAPNAAALALRARPGLPASSTIFQTSLS